MSSNIYQVFHVSFIKMLYSPRTLCIPIISILGQIGPKLEKIQSLNTGITTSIVYGIQLKVGQIKKISVFLVRGLKLGGRVCTHIFSNYFFSGKYIILCISKGISPFKMHKIIFFSKNLKKILDFTIVNLGRARLSFTQVFGLIQIVYFSVQIRLLNNKILAKGKIG